MGYVSYLLLQQIHHYISGQCLMFEDADDCDDDYFADYPIGYDIVMHETLLLLLLLPLLLFCVIFLYITLAVMHFLGGLT